jgi:hypothetical protein
VAFIRKHTVKDGTATFHLKWRDAHGVQRSQVFETHAAAKAARRPAEEEVERERKALRDGSPIGARVKLSCRLNGAAAVAW